MKRMIVAATLALVFMTTAAYAEDFSVGLTIGSSKVEVDDATSDLTFDGSDVGFKVYGKYMFNDTWGVEGGYASLGEPDDTLLDSSVDIEIDGIAAYAVGVYPTSETIDIFGKAGFVSWDAEFSGVGGSAKDDGFDLAFGFGGAYQATSTVAIRGEWEYFDIDDTESVWMLSIGFELGFK